MDSHSATSGFASYRLQPVELKLTDVQAEELLTMLTRMMCEWVSLGFDVRAFPLTIANNQSGEADHVAR